MKKTFVIAPDSFKESLTAKEACEAMARGIQKVFQEAELIKVPMADGGEGTLDALIDATNGEKKYVTASGPFPLKKVTTYYGFLGDSTTAVIEMAKINGLELLTTAERNPLLTSTYGTGELIKSALDHGAKKIILAIGGSATNDGGAGMAQALGAKLLDKKGHPIKLGGGNLDQLAHIDCSAFEPRLKDVALVVACDVTNPLLGIKGATHVFGSQKGATLAMIEKLEHNLASYAKIIERDLNRQVATISGAGAAGGLGAGLLAFTSAELKSGIEIVIQATELEHKIQKADYVFTGEGGIDYQTKFGKTPYGVAKTARKYHVPVFVCAGYVGEHVESLYEEGITAIFGILNQAEPLPKALPKGAANLERTSENIARVLCQAAIKNSKE
ncbi:glycerate kinase family protein [Enterococcus faecalis]